MICRNCSVLIPPGSNFCPRCGKPPEAAAAFATASGATAAPPASEQSKRRVRKLILFLVLAPVLLMTTCVGAIFGGVFYAMRSSEPYAHALKLAREHPQVQQALGTPIEPGWFTSGNISTEGSGGTAKLSIPISGPKGSATIYVDAEKRAGKWQYTQLQVGVAGQDMNVDLLEPQMQLQ